MGCFCFSSTLAMTTITPKRRVSLSPDTHHPEIEEREREREIMEGSICLLRKLCNVNHNFNLGWISILMNLRGRLVYSKHLQSQRTEEMAAWLINARTQQMGSVKGLTERDGECKNWWERVTVNGRKRTQYSISNHQSPNKVAAQNQQLKKAGSTK